MSEKHNHEVKRGRGRPRKNNSHIPKEEKENVEGSSCHVNVEKTTQSEYVAPTVQIHPIRKDAPATNYFILCNGQPVKNVKELADLMDSIEDQVFSHHVNADKNDFSAWIADIFNDVELAKKIADAKDKKHMQLVLYKHVVHKLW